MGYLLLIISVLYHNKTPGRSCDVRATCQCFMSKVITVHVQGQWYNTVM